MMFHLGQKIVCVDDNWRPETFAQCPNRPVRGGVYTVRGIEDSDDPKCCAVLLEEIINPVRPYVSAAPSGEILFFSLAYREPSFYSWRFRAVHERKTDISIFTGILNDVRSKEPVPA